MLPEEQQEIVQLIAKLEREHHQLMDETRSAYFHILVIIDQDGTAETARQLGVSLQTLRSLLAVGWKDSAWPAAIMRWRREGWEATKS